MFARKTKSLRNPNAIRRRVTIFPSSNAATRQRDGADRSLTARCHRFSPIRFAIG
jgi:hypothetical protein